MDSRDYRAMNAQNAPSVILIILVTTSLHAQVIPGRWEKVDSLPSGKEIIANLETGERIEGKFLTSDPATLTLANQNGNELKLDKLKVLKITSQAKVPDSLKNGVLVGAGVGALVGGVMAVASSDPDVTAAFAGGALVGLGVGALIGLWVDDTRKKAEVLYVAFGQ